MATLVVSSRRPIMSGGGSYLLSSTRTAAIVNRSRAPRHPPPSSSILTRRTFFSRGGGNQHQQQQSHHHHHHYENKRAGGSASSRSGGSGFFSSFPFHDDRDPGLRWTSTVSNPDEVDGPVGIPSRAQQIRRLQNHENENDKDNNIYDVLVVGGGATGAGIALDAASRISPNNKKMKVACVERGDFASETSSRSTKLIWAGLKYMGTAGAALLRPSKLLTQPITTLQEFWTEMKMVYHCHVERHYMTTTNVHLTYWVPIVVPFYTWYCTPPPMGHALYSWFPILAPPTFQFYDALSYFTCPHAYIMMNPQRIQETIPQLKKDGLKYCAIFYEAMHNDARTNLAIAMTAAKFGAHIANYVEVIQLLYDDNDNDDTQHHDDNNDKKEERNDSSSNNNNNKRATGVVAVDRMTNQVFKIRAKKIIFAGGPFTDELRVMEENSPKLSLSWQQQQNDDNETNHQQHHHRIRTLRRSPTKPAVRGAAGTHVVVPNNVIPHNMGLLNFNTSDGRFLFMLPWLGHTLIGTTDKQNGPGAETLHNPPRDEVDWILREASMYLETPLQRSDVLSAWRGWRPLATDPHHIASDDDGDDHAVSRDHVISENPQTGVIFIAGGKWTTWRAMAEDVVNRLTNAPCQTLNIPLHGGLENSSNSSKNTKLVVQQLESLPFQVVKRYGQLDLDIAKHLVSTYGGRVWEVCALLDEEENEENSSQQASKGAGGNRSKSSRHPSSNNELGQRLVQNFPYIQAEVVYACREYACTVEDVLSRRTRLSFLNKQAALEALPLVAQLMSRELGWTKAVTLAQTQAARQYIDSYGGRVLGATDAATVTDNNKDINKVSFIDNADDSHHDPVQLGRDNKGWLHRITAAAVSGLKMTSMQRHGQQQHHHHVQEAEDSDDEQEAA